MASNAGTVKRHFILLDRSQRLRAWLSGWAWRRPPQQPSHVTGVALTRSFFAERLQGSRAPLQGSPEGKAPLATRQPAETGEFEPERRLNVSLAGAIVFFWRRSVSERSAVGELNERFSAETTRAGAVGFGRLFFLFCQRSRGRGRGWPRPMISLHGRSVAVRGATRHLRLRHPARGADVSRHHRQRP